MGTRRTAPSRRRSLGTTVTMALALVALVAAVAIGVYVVVQLTEVVGFATYLRLLYGGWG